MSTEKPTSQDINQPKVWVTKEEINNRESSSDLSKKLTQINNILQIADFSDSKEEIYRKVLLKQNFETLQNLSTKSKKEIFFFLIKENKKWKVLEVKDQKLGNKIINQKIQKIKLVFPISILNKNPKIADKLNSLDWITDPVKKEKILKDILELLKEPWKLKSIINDLGGADKNSFEYVEFKKNLLELDSSFESYFVELENGFSLNTNEIVDGIETGSDGVIDIDLKANPPVSKMSLVWSDYAFEEKLDKKALDELMSTNQAELEAVKKSFWVLQSFWVSFDELLKALSSNWGKKDFKTTLSEVVNNFSTDVFSSLDDVYEWLDIEWNKQLKEADIKSFSTIKNPKDLQLMIENIKAKFLHLKTNIVEKQNWVLTDYKRELKALLQRDSETKEKQLKVLEFFKASGFDLIPKEISTRIMSELKSGILIIPWLPLSAKNIDLKNGNFWESSVFSNKEDGLNIEWKRNIVKFVNKIISWNIDEPVAVESIVSWLFRVDPLMLKSDILNSGVANKMGWKYTRVMENLKKDNEV